MQFSQKGMNNLQCLLKRPVITQLTKMTGCVYIFGGAITDALFCLKTPIVKIFSFDDINFEKMSFHWEEVKYKNMFGETNDPICWKYIENGITYLLFTKKSINDTLHKEIVNPDDILLLGTFNYEMIYIPTSTTEMHGSNEFMTFMERKLISLSHNKKLESSIVSSAIKASKRYKYPFDTKLAKEVSMFCKSIKKTQPMDLFKK